jgi:tRNA threonylcarbamoyl adenosine modification protein YjeE
MLLTRQRLEGCAEALGRVLRSGDVVLLEGPMGAGKTTFARALARGLGVDRPERVCSPTFNVCLIHRGPIALWHVDLFRLAEVQPGSVGAAAFEALGLEALADRLTDDSGIDDGVLVVEWADLLRELGQRGPMAEHLRVRIDPSPSGDPDARAVTVTASGPRHAARLQTWRAAAQQRNV